MAALLSSRWLLLSLIVAGCSDGEREVRRKALGPQPSFETLMANANPEAGARAFGACAACHTIGKGGANRAGPNLHAIMGKPVAANPAFGYSYALKSMGGIWTPERMDAWLAAPATFAPRTSMAYPGMRDPLTRADVISYLHKQEDNAK
ncbi:MAG: c-type cytochrome [Ferrovibrio sp.]